MKRKPILGETLFDAQYIGNSRDAALKAVIVKSVGRKYFTCEQKDGEWKPETTFHLDTWREKTDYSPSHQLYENEQEYQNGIEANVLFALIRQRFSDFGRRKIPLENLRKIKQLTEETK